MPTATVEKPKFSVDQLTSATDAAKRFAEVRKRAKCEPQFITDHNVVDSVIMSYADYESMYCELAELRDQELIVVARRRISDDTANAGQKRISLADAMSRSEYDDYLACDAESVSDEDLFE